MITIENTIARTPSARRARFNAEVCKVRNQTGLSYREAFDLVANDPTFSSEFSNDASKADPNLADASKRTVILQQKINELLKSMNWGPEHYDTAYNLALKQNPELANAMKKPNEPAPQSFTRYNFADAQSSDGNMPKPAIQDQPPGDWKSRIGTSERPFVKTPVAV